MAFDNLSDREKQILFNLINHYVQNADPVGSRVIANRFGMGLSSATIRNTLADLEELGLVEQPHVSAGRVPTDLGYRVYVDSLLKPEQLSDAEKEYIKGSILREGRGLKEVLGQTSKVLGEITRQLGVGMAPRFEKGRLKRLELIPITEERIMVVVVVESGLARSVVIEVEAALDEHSLQRFEQLLNERLAGLSLGEIRSSLEDRLADIAGTGRLLRVLVDAEDKLWSGRRSSDIKVAGLENLIAQPEFASPDAVAQLVRLFEDNQSLSEFLAAAHDSGLVITIGRENRFAEVMNCSLVTSKYQVGKIRGTIGIIGPTRMPYSKLVSVVEYTAKAITDALSGLDSSEEASP